jgi:dTDP-4-dehydrorhamnose reductase
MKTIAIIGAKGMLGIDMTEEAKKRGYTVLEYDRDTLDITSLSEVEKLKSENIDLVINCAAYTDVNGAEDNRDLAFKVNTYGPEYLAGLTRDLDIPLVHISTDYVFDGSISEGYVEDNQQFGPLNVYGKSKLEGEVRVASTNPKHYIIRTSWLFGEHGKNFVSTMVKLATERESLTVVNDQFGNPTYTKDLVNGIMSLLEDEVNYGVYHLTNSTPEEKGITWFDLAKCAIEAKGLKTSITPVTSEVFPQKATRPQYSTLKNTKRPKLPDYREAVVAYVQTLTV